MGKTVTFECQATGAAPLICTWLHNGNEIIPAKNERKLEFIVQKHKSGEYSCLVKNEFGSKRCAPVKLTVGEYNHNVVQCVFLASARTFTMISM